MISKELWPTEELFDCLLDTVFFVKNTEGQYIVVNDTLVKRCDLRKKKDLLGKKPSEVQGKRLGKDYEKQDSKVLATGQPIVNQLELHVYPNHAIGWCMTNKFAVCDASGQLLGLAGISQDLRTPDRNHEDYAQLQSVINYAENHLFEAPSVKALAEIAHLSPYQLDRRIRGIFGLSTGQWILKMRLDLAQHQLQKTAIPISEIAANAGYEDQSAFSRQFRRATGFSPLAFRKTRID